MYASLGFTSVKFMRPQRIICEVLAGRAGECNTGVQACLGKNMVRLTDHPAMAIAVDWDNKQQNKHTILSFWSPINILKHK